MGSDQTFTNPVFTGDTINGYRWGDGAAFFAGFSTALPPNKASCFTAAASHWDPGFFTATSRHVGGVQVLMADGAVRFISENIDAGNQSAAPPAEGGGGLSPYGVWGALGTKTGAETVAEF
jgi:prepilin-type processing-associated H-X9-DG protein